MPRYVQAAELMQLPHVLRVDKLELLYIGYGLAVVALVFVSYLAGAFGWLPHDPRAMNVALINAPAFTPGHPLGTDFLGRDLASRLILGIQAYFVPGLLAVAIALVGGSMLGILAGWHGGWWDTLITYFANLLDSFPRL